jgi:hypothetical protein
MRGRMTAGAVGLGCAGLTVLAMLTFVPTAVAIPKGPALPKTPVAPKAPAGQPCGSPDCGSGERTCGSPDCASPGDRDRGYGSPDSGGSDDGRASAGNGDAAADCRDAIGNTAPGGSRGLKLTASVPNQATVAPGEDITVRLTWNPTDWSDRDLDMALACVRVKGGLDDAMSREERPSANDGAYEYRIHVPDNIKPGCDICVQGFLAGTAADGGPEQVGSNEQCFMSGNPEPPTPPAAQAPAPVTSPGTPARAPAEVPSQVAGSDVSRPAPANPLTAPEVAPGAELPRTGGSTVDVGAAGGGLTLALGGLAVIGGAGRRTRRRIVS